VPEWIWTAPADAGEADGMSKRGWSLFVAMSVLWGIPYLLIKVALRDVSAPFLVFARTGIGAAVLLPVAARRGLIGPALRRWPWILTFAVLEIAVPWLLLGDAERHLSSSLAGLLVAAMPLIVAVIMWRLGDASAVAGLRLLGLAVGLVGVAALVGLNVGAVSAPRMGEVLAVALGYAVAPIIADRTLKEVPTLAVVSLSLTAVAVLYLPVAVADHPRRMPAAAPLAAVIALGLVCTATAFLLFFGLIAEAGPARAAMITFVNPVVAAVAGVVVLGESLRAGTMVGTVLVLAGVGLSTLARPPQAPRPPRAGVDTGTGRQLLRVRRFPP
jgi:drug/metabolite transporter (DMT)-like permease